MNIDNFISSISSGESTTKYTPKVIRCKINAWFSQQQFQPLALSSENRTQLKNYFNIICTKTREVSHLVDYVAGLTFFHTTLDPLNSLSLILQKEKTDLRDYKQLLENSNILLFFIEDLLINRTLCWLQDRIIELWNSNKFIPAGTSVHAKFNLSLFDVDEILKPATFVLMYYIFASQFQYRSDEFLTFQERFNPSDDVLKFILTWQNSHPDPVCDRILEEIFNLFEIGSAMREFDDVKASIKDSSVIANHIPLLATLMPLTPAYKELIRSPKVFDTSDPLDGSKAFAEMAAMTNDRKENLLKVYQQILTKMALIKNNSSLRDKPNFEVLYPEPQGTFEVFRDKIELYADYHYTTSFRQKLSSLSEEIAPEESPTPEPTPSEHPAPEPIPQKPPRQYDDRVLRWYDPNNDPFVNDPKYMNIPPKKQPQIRFIHNFAKIIDDISARCGRRFLRPNKQGIDELMISMVIQADTPFSKKTQTYVSTITMYNRSVIYHRTLTKKSQGALIDEMTSKGVYERAFPPLNDSVKISSIVPKELRNKVADDGSYIVKVEGKVITVADPKWPLADGSPTLLYVLVI